jgi:hypothetical protein
MGLQKNITLDNGINLPEAYMKITSMNIIYKSTVTITVNIYKDFDARQANKPSVVAFQHTCRDGDYFTYFVENVLLAAGVSDLSQAYLWLKTLPFYDSAIDINMIDKE